jgi:hypothetical protein
MASLLDSKLRPTLGFRGEVGADPIQAVRASGDITRIALAFEAGHDGFWLARWFEARGVEDDPIFCG